MLTAFSWKEVKMIRSAMCAAVALLSLLRALPGAAVERELDSHEYKMLLMPSLFAGEPNSDMVNRVWTGKIRDRLAAVDGVKLNDKDFAHDKTRWVKFRDIRGECFLWNNDYILRERTKLEDGEPKTPKATLKYRHEKKAMAAAVHLNGDDAKFEEDVGLTMSKTDGEKRRYSLSGKVKLEDGEVVSLADLKKLFPRFEETFPAVRDRDDGLETVSGLTITERVFEGPVLELGGAKVEADATVSLWYRPDGSDVGELLLAEFSFGYKRRNHGAADLKEADTVGVKALETLIPLMTESSVGTKTRSIYELDDFCDD